MKARDRDRIRRAVNQTRCPDCNRFRLAVQDIRNGAVSVLCDSCGWFNDDWKEEPE